MRIPDTALASTDAEYSSENCQNSGDCADSASCDDGIFSPVGACAANWLDVEGGYGAGDLGRSSILAPLRSLDAGRRRCLP